MGESLAEALRFVELGTFRLRGLPEHETLYQVTVSDLPARFPPPVTDLTDAPARFRSRLGANRRTAPSRSHRRQAKTRSSGGTSCSTATRGERRNRRALPAPAQQPALPAVRGAVRRDRRADHADALRQAAGGEQPEPVQHLLHLRDQQPRRRRDRDLAAVRRHPRLDQPGRDDAARRVPRPARPLLQRRRRRGVRQRRLPGQVRRRRGRGHLRAAADRRAARHPGGGRGARPDEGHRARQRQRPWVPLGAGVHTGPGLDGRGGRWRRREHDRPGRCGERHGPAGVAGGGGRDPGHDRCGHGGRASTPPRSRTSRWS